MDIDSQTKKSYPRFIGILLALFIPGIAHYLSGAKKTGWILLSAVIGLSAAGLCLAAVPNLFALYPGLVLLFLILPIFISGILITSYRPIPRLTGKGWAGLLGTIILFNIFKLILLSAMPVVPHQIPTGAMEPTLLGMHVTPGTESTSFFDRLFSGRHHEEYIANDSGPISNPGMNSGEMSFNIGSKVHKLPADIMSSGMKKNYNRGDVIWSGTVQKGDRILANKFSYLFSQPRRGDIVTFSTDGLDHQAVRPGSIYIKRIVGLPGETVSIRDGRLTVNNEPITEPAIFQTLEYGYAGQLSDANQSITLDEEEYLTLGDNTGRNMSLDGRFFGAIERDSIIAKVQSVYWPFNRIRIVE
ncbi:signal peptidase I [Pontiellaceae bacterium B12219]|nr:signal peptidase I [Pontiellaceae bacterium B12219]